MPPVYTVLNARVKQKLATEADWIAAEPSLGVIFEGEQAFVYDGNGVPVNFKIGDGTKLFSQLPYFIAYYADVVNLKTLFYLSQTANITTAGVFRANSDLQKVILLNNSGSDINLRIGTTNGGNEIAEITLPSGVNQLQVDYYFTSAETVYFTGLTGVNFSLIVLYCQLDTAPVTPPTSLTPTGGGLRYGTVYEFFPAYPGHEDVVWDFVSGYGKPGSGYEDAMLWGTNGLPELPDYLKGYVEGDTIGGNVGSNDITIEMTNLPDEGLGMFTSNVNNVNGDTPTTDSPVARAASDGNPLSYEMRKGNLANPYIGKTAPMGDGTPIDSRPSSKIVLRYTGIPTTT